MVESQNDNLRGSRVTVKGKHSGKSVGKWQTSVVRLRVFMTKFCNTSVSYIVITHVVTWRLNKNRNCLYVTFRLSSKYTSDLECFTTTATINCTSLIWRFFFTERMSSAEQQCVGPVLKCDRLKTQTSLSYGSVPSQETQTYFNQTKRERAVIWLLYSTDLCLARVYSSALYSSKMSSVVLY